MLFLSQRIINFWVSSSLFVLNFGQQTETETITTAGKAKFYVRKATSDRHILWEIWHNQDYGDLSTTIRPTDTIVDIGGHIGVFTILAAKAAKRGHVYTLEPMSENFIQLQKNVRLNRLHNVSIYKLGISNKSKNVLLHFGGPNLGGNSLYKKTYTDRSEEISCVSLEAFLHKNAITHVNFLKLDVEGSEYDILLSTKNSVLKKIDRIALEFHNNMGQEHSIDKITSKLTQCGFQVKFHTSWFTRTVFGIGTLSAHR